METIKLKDAIYRMNSGDRFEPEQGNVYCVMEMNRAGILLNDEGGRIGFGKRNMNIDGRIIPVGPKVLTVVEMLETLNISLRDTSSFLHDGCHRESIQRANQNGRLERDLEWREHIKNNNTRCEILENIENLKPLNDE